MVNGATATNQLALATSGVLKEDCSYYVCINMVQLDMKNKEQRAIQRANIK